MILLSLLRQIDYCLIGDSVANALNHLNARILDGRSVFQSSKRWTLPPWAPGLGLDSLRATGGRVRPLQS